MKIAIVGLGVAGGYLAARLARETEHEVYGFDALSSVETRCAWGASKHELGAIVKALDINFEDFVLFEGKRIKVIYPDSYESTIPLVGLVTFDKDALEREFLRLAKEAGAKLQLGKRVSLNELSSFELVVDATGVYRAILPKIKEDMIMPNLEYRVQYDEMPFDDFTIFPYSKLGGYTWFFPLGSGMAHVGGGDKFHRQREFVESFMQKHNGKKLKTIARPIRIVPFEHAQPIFLKRENQIVVGAGESIGCVFPLLGEGIIPSLQCAQLLFENITQKMGLDEYVNALKNKFFYFEPIFKIIIAKWNGRWSEALKAHLIPSYIRVKRMEKRFGFKIRMRDLLDVFNRT
jgi:flavin-dependent dehydrogenase